MVIVSYCVELYRVVICWVGLVWLNNIRLHWVAFF